ncbi:MAG: phosphotransferase [Chlorobium sp.]|nr:phosphotransferase [Chlorobium sp.]MCW8819451.1 phosphotransferase [Ignavibacteriaceae bacterium]
MPSLQHDLSVFFSDPELEKIRIDPISGDASSRKYYRLRSPEKSWVLCVDKEFTASPTENYPFLVVQHLFSDCSVPVPAIIGSDKHLGMILQEDCGDTLLQNALTKNGANTGALYRNAIDIMATIQSIKADTSEIPFNRCFDEEKLMFEFTFFLEHAKRHAPSQGFSGKISTMLHREFRSITQLLLRPEYFVLNHRDYHSRNILVSPAGSMVIDFQDARMGLPQYDAVSLLRDSYVTLEQHLVDDLQRYHYDRLREKNLTVMSYDEYLYLFDIMAFQRNIKALGTFFNQAYYLGKKEFEQYISPTLAYLPEYINRHTELATSGEIILNTLAKSTP